MIRARKPEKQKGIRPERKLEEEINSNERREIHSEGLPVSCVSHERYDTAGVRKCASCRGNGGSTSLTIGTNAPGNLSSRRTERRPVCPPLSRPRSKWRIVSQNPCREVPKIESPPTR